MRFTTRYFALHIQTIRFIAHYSFQDETIFFMRSELCEKLESKGNWDTWMSGRLEEIKIMNGWIH